MNDDDNEEAVGTRNDDRLAMFNGIADSAEEGRSDEFDTENIDHGSDEEKEEKEVKQETRQTIRVNGVDVELTPEIIERAQKVEAADAYLREASRIKKEAEENSRRSSTDAVQSVEEDDTALARALQMGSEEEAVEAIKAIRSRTPSLTKDEVVHAARDAIAMDEAVKNFQKDYAFIWSDPYLTKLAMTRDNELLASENLSYSERYKKIGDEIAKWTNNLPKGGFSSKEDKKSAASENVVQISSKRADVAQAEETEESAQDVIAQMAKRRGQQI